MIPIWHQEEGKWYLIPNRVRSKLQPGDKLRYAPDIECWTIYGGELGITDFIENILPLWHKTDNKWVK